MRASWISHTSTTGGTGDLTLVRETGKLSWVDVFGSSGTRFVEYVIEEAANNKREAGVGSIALSTGVLARTCPMETQDGTTWDGTVPSKISFGTTGVVVHTGPIGSYSPLRVPFFPTSSPAADAGYCGVIGSGINTTVTNDREYYVRQYWPGGIVTQVAIYVFTAQTGGALKWSIHEIGSDGLPGQKLHGTASSIACTSTGLKTESVSFYLPPGYYDTGTIVTTSSGSLAVGGAYDVLGYCMGASSFNYKINAFYKAGSYSTGLPSTAPTGLSANFFSGSPSGFAPLVLLKPSNT